MFYVFFSKNYHSGTIRTNSNHNSSKDGEGNPDKESGQKASTCATWWLLSRVSHFFLILQIRNNFVSYFAFLSYSRKWNTWKLRNTTNQKLCSHVLFVVLTENTESFVIKRKWHGHFFARVRTQLFLNRAITMIVGVYFCRLQLL